MRNFNALLLAAALAVGCWAGSCTPVSQPEMPGIVGDKPAGGADDKEEGEENNQPEETMTIKITVGGKVFKADIDDTATGRAFLARLPLTLDMSELNGNEKYCYGIALPRADRHFDTLSAGDLMLYAGNCVVLFYGPAGGYSYTRIGRLQSADGLAAALGSGSVTVAFGNE